MVVVCEKCETRFHLDDTRVPAKGARVRCSRCKHAFFVRPEVRDKAALVEELAADAVQAGGVPLPEATQDLSAASQSEWEEPHAQASLLQSSGDGPRSELEEDWQFNDDSPSPFDAPPAGGMAALGEADLTPSELGAELTEPEIAVGDGLDMDALGEDPAPSELTAADPIMSIRARDAEEDSSSFDDLGSPEDWNFVAADETGLDPAAGFTEAVSRESDVAAPDATQAAATATRAASALDEESGDRASLFGRLSSVASVAGWILIVSAFAMGMSSLVTPSAESTASRREASEVPIAGLALRAHQVEARIVENAVAGDLFVVSGVLENRGDSPLTLGATVRVQLLAADRLPIAGAVATAGPALEESRLREQEPERLQHALARAAEELSQRLIWPGERLAFDAVFDAIPASTAGWALEGVPVTAELPPTSSLPPTARPSWE